MVNRNLAQFVTVACGHVTVARHHLEASSGVDLEPFCKEDPSEGGGRACWRNPEPSERPANPKNLGETWRRGAESNRR